VLLQASNLSLDVSDFAFFLVSVQVLLEGLSSTLLVKPVERFLIQSVLV
jgi:hypothetical protein